MAGSDGGLVGGLVEVGLVFVGLEFGGVVLVGARVGMLIAAACSSISSRNKSFVACSDATYRTNCCISLFFKYCLLRLK